MNYEIKTLDQLRPILIGLRKQAGLSQMAVASLMGVSQQSYSKIEANPATASVERLFKILKLLRGRLVVGERDTTHDDFVLARGEERGKSKQSLEKTAAMPEGSSPKLRPGPPLLKKMKKREAAPPKLVPPSQKKEDW